LNGWSQPEAGVGSITRFTATPAPLVLFPTLLTVKTRPAANARQCHNSAMSPCTTPRVSIQTQDFDLNAEIATLRAQDGCVGAVCSFIGTVRDRNTGPTGEVQSMELEHYPGMTEQSIDAMIDAAMQRFDIFGARVIHRVGLLQPLDQIVMVAVTSAHRGESFQACEFLMDYLKTQAPFWKKEQTADGARWVDARVSDDAALAKWGIVASNG
jgi:molybdopterin synthase catalytic subunit